jgi:hypothetical protein
MDLIKTISNTNFTWPTTFERRHHSPPYSILCVFPHGLHPNVIFPWDSQVKVPKLGLLLSQDFGHSYLSQINFFLDCKDDILWPLKISFQWCIARSNWTSFDPCFQGICGRESNSQFDSRLFFFHNSCKSSLNEQCESTLNIYISRPF